MILCDVNVLVYAFRQDAPRHAECRAWLMDQLAGPSSVGVSDQVLSGVVRVVTHPRVFKEPSSVEEALEFVDAVRTSPVAVPVNPGTRHWGVFRDLCWEVGARGNLVPDAWYAALAIESGCEWITTDRDYARFPGLRWRVPLD